MGLSKVKYELIADESARRQMLRKRKAGLLNKVSELKTLCSIDACAIIYNNDDVLPDIWPSPIEAYNLLQRFGSLPTMKQRLNMFNQETFLGKNILRLNQSLERQKKKNRGLVIEQLLTKCLVEDNFPDLRNLQDLEDVDCLLLEKMKIVNSGLENIKHSESIPITANNKNENGARFDKGKKPL